MATTTKVQRKTLLLKQSSEIQKEHNKLFIEIVEGRDLKAADIGGTSDPYVVIPSTTGLHGEGKTSVCKKTLFPVWNQKFTFEFTWKLTRICFEVLDHDVIGADDPLGKVKVEVNDLLDGQEKDLWLPLKIKSAAAGLAKFKGEIHIKIRAEWAFVVASPGKWVDLSEYRDTTLVYGLGWDCTKNRENIDLDASVAAVDLEGKILGAAYHRHLSAFNGALKHSGDSRTGSTTKDSEEVAMSLINLPPTTAKLLLFVNCFSGKGLENIRSAFLRIHEMGNETDTLCFYRLPSSKLGKSPGMLFGVLEKTSKGGWLFQTLAIPLSGKDVLESLQEALFHSAKVTVPLTQEDSFFWHLVGVNIHCDLQSIN